MKRLFIGLIVGGFLGAYFATLMCSQLLQRFFAVYAFLMSIRLWVSIPVLEISTRLLKQPCLVVSCASFCGVSALAVTGGGTMVVPYLFLAGQKIQTAIGTSAACAFSIAVSGVLGFIATGQQHQIAGEWRIGFIYWLAFLGLISISMISAPLAVKWSRNYPLVSSERLFSLVSMAVSISLFLVRSV